MALTGRTIVITRGANQSIELKTQLEDLGARVIECPMIEIVPLSDWTEVDAALRQLHTYHWLLFTSSNAVEPLMRRAELAGVRCNVPIAVVGSATESRLKHWGLTATIMPEDFRAEGLLSAFPRNLSGVRILFPRAETARELLPRELRKRGAHVDVLTVYRTIKSAGTAPNIRDILASEKVDCIVFTSSSTVRYLAETVGSDLPTLLGNTAIAVIGPVTRETARESGLNPLIEPTRSTIADLVHAISDRLSME
jgi:uroporphyrinogen-III synthase